MQEGSFLIEIAKVYGFPALIFIIWFIYHKSQVATFKSIIDNNFKLLGGLLESVQYQASLLAKISEQISANQYCPLMRKDFGSYPHSDRKEHQY